MVLSRRLWIYVCVLVLLAALTGSAAAQFLIDGSVGPSVPINGTPPRPTNPSTVFIGQPGRLIVNTDNLNLRSGPSAEYTQVGIVDGGTQLLALGTNGDFETLWWYVEVGGLRGWVSDEFVVIRGDLRGLPVVEPQGEISQPTLYIGVNNPVYTIPNPFSEPLCEVEGNLFYYVLGVDSAAVDWFLIEVPCLGETRELWIQADRGLLRNPADLDLPIIEG